MKWTVGMPAETQLSIAAMILGGAFDALPENLRIMFAHGGGSFAFLLGRLENAYLHRGECPYFFTLALSRSFTSSACEHAAYMCACGKVSLCPGCLAVDIARGMAQHPPSHYLPRFATDSAVSNSQIIVRALVALGRIGLCFMFLSGTLAAVEVASAVLVAKSSVALVLVLPGVRRARPAVPG